MSRVRLDRALVLEVPVRVADGAGGFAEGWQAVGTVWAEVRPGLGRMVGGMEAEAVSQSLRITVRGLPQENALRPRAGQRFREGARLFLIGAVAERDGTGRYLICAAEEVFG